MTKYIMWGSYCEDVLTKREPYRQDHLAGLAKQKQAGILITIGPTKDVTQLVESDPYWQNGIWIEYSVKEWIQAF
jgi:uncharacterized protein YciI